MSECRHAARPRTIARTFSGPGHAWARLGFLYGSVPAVATCCAGSVGSREKADPRPSRDLDCYHGHTDVPVPGSAFDMMALPPFENAQSTSRRRHALLELVLRRVDTANPWDDMREFGKGRGITIDVCLAPALGLSKIRLTNNRAIRQLHRSCAVRPLRGHFQPNSAIYTSQPTCR